MLPGGQTIGYGQPVQYDAFFLASAKPSNPVGAISESSTGL